MCFLFYLFILGVGGIFYSGVIRYFLIPHCVLTFIWLFFVFISLGGYDIMEKVRDRLI